MEQDNRFDALIIEDNTDDSELTAYALLQSIDNVRLKHFPDGIDALNFMFAKNGYAGSEIHSEIKFVVLDLNLPGMDGLEVLRKIRAVKETRRIPVIVLSSSRDPDDIEIAYHLGANSYVVKPTGFEGYVKKIGSLAYYWNSVNQHPA